MKNILIFGATSGIASEITKIYGRSDNNLFLFGRSENKLSSLKNELIIKSKGVNIELIKFDAEDYQDLENKVKNIISSIKTIDIIIISHAVMPKFLILDHEYQKDFNLIDINVKSSVLIINLLVKNTKKIEIKKIVFLSSVAGERGRGSNYVYGASKAFMNIYLQGLQNILFKEKIKLLNIKLGPVNTNLSKNSGNDFLKIEPSYAAKKIVRSINSNQQEVFVPFYWKYIMFIIKMIPNFVFNRLSL
tara:strand:+ start:2156 stop:2896 length:741 start_codon:yes stop_codon:yes gene_type:complete